MGKLILCSGVRTKRPYIFTSTGVRIYSIEELCCYLYHHVYLIDEKLFTDSLIDWIATELKLVERAGKLKKLKEQKTDLKTMVTVVMCSADYYTEKEIMELLKTLDQVIGMPPFKRNFIKANHFLKDNQFNEAIEEYERILSSEEAVMLTPGEYGDILHNLAVAKVHTVGMKEASEFFRQAYERNQREESLRQYLYSVKLSNNMQLFYEKIEEYQIDRNFSNQLLNDIEQTYHDAENSEMMPELRQLKQWKDKGNIGKYYKRSNEIIDVWKATVRQI